MRQQCGSGAKKISSGLLDQAKVKPLGSVAGFIAFGGE
jgi:hypothetical protein